MAAKRKFKRDYIILEAKDMNFRYKERVLPKAFAKVEINEEKSIVSLYVENLKSMKEGYRVVAIQSDYETLDLGNIVLSEHGKGEFAFCGDLLTAHPTILCAGGLFAVQVVPTPANALLLDVSGVIIPVDNKNFHTPPPQNRRTGLPASCVIRFTSLTISTAIFRPLI